MTASRAVLPLALLGALVAGLLVVRPSQREVSDPSKNADSICSTDSPYSAEAALGEPRHRFSAAVPADNPLPGQGETRIYPVAKNDVIQVEVSAPRPGAVAVHGILEAHRVRVGGVVSVKLRAKYTGRFPLHFHGEDGSHFEVAAFEVLP